MRGLKALFTPVFHILVEIFIALPLLYVIGGVLMGTPMVYFYIGSIFFAAFMGVLTRKLISVPILQVVLGLGICLAIILFFNYRYNTGENTYFIPAVMVILVFFRGESHAQDTGGGILPGSFTVVLLLATFLTLAVMDFSGRLSAFRTGITILGSIAVVAALLYMSSQRITEISERDKTHSEASTFTFSKNVGSLSRILITIILIIGLLMSAGPALPTAAKSVGGLIGRGVALLSPLFNFDFTLDGFEPEPEPEPDPEIPGDDVVWSAWGNGLMIFIIRVILVVVVTAVVVGGVILVLTITINHDYKVFQKLLSALRKRFGKLRLSSAADFDDSRESTVDPSQLPKMYLDNARDRLAGVFRRKPTWEDQKTVADKVKFLFRRAVIKAESSGYRHNAAFTVAEVFREAAAHCPVVMPTAEGIKSAYNLVKYSTVLPSEAEVDAIHRRTWYK